MHWWNYHYFQSTRSDRENCEGDVPWMETYIWMLPCAADVGISWLKTGITKSFYGPMGWFWLSSQRNIPRIPHNTIQENKDTGLGRWVTTWRHSSTCLTFPSAFACPQQWEYWNKIHLDGSEQLKAQWSSSECFQGLCRSYSPAHSIFKAIANNYLGNIS